MSDLIYFRDGTIVAESGNIRAFSMNGELFLEQGPGRNLWALEKEIYDYIEQLGDKPKGRCLEIGLGLGIASRCILSYPSVRSLTTVEINKDVIDVHKQLCTILDSKENEHRWYPYNKCTHRIRNCDGLEYLYKTTTLYDFIFLDCWAHIDEETLPMIADLVRAGKKCLTDNGIILGWFDPYTPEEYVEPFYSLFR